MKTFSSLALLLALAQTTLCRAATASDLQTEFLTWKASPAGQVAYTNGYVPSVQSTHESTITAGPSADELARFQAAKDTIAKLQREQPLATFSYNTPFALLTHAEFQAFVGSNDVAAEVTTQLRALRAKHDDAEDAGHHNRTIASARRHLAAQADDVAVDWTRKGCVSPPIDQGKCQASWAVAAVGALEAAHCINTGSLVALSTQDVLSCSGARASNICTKGVSARAFDYVSRLNNGAVCSAESYAYASSDGTSPDCRKTSDAAFNCATVDVGAHFYDVRSFRDHSELELVVQKQPVAALVNAGSSYFQFIQGGVLSGNDASCPASNIDASVLIVGYGTLNGVAYWKIKNSWSPYWGDGGYALIERGFQGASTGACGIETLGYYPMMKQATNWSLKQRCSAIHERHEVLGVTLATVQNILKPQDCCDQCRRAGACVAFNWRYASDECELKKTLTGEQPNAPGASLTYAGTVMTRDLRIREGTISDNVDFAGNDLFALKARDADECLDKCNQEPLCHAFTWSSYASGSCYLKSKQAVEPKWVAPDSNGVPVIRSGTSYKCAPVQSNTDVVGLDLSAALAPSVRHCCGICRVTDKCGAFSWSDYNGGTCWLKQAGATTTAAPGVSSAYLS